jgi:hypothetical protein
MSYFKAIFFNAHKKVHFSVKLPFYMHGEQLLYSIFTNEEKIIEMWTPYNKTSGGHKFN